MEEILDLVKNGISEITLLGQNVNSYGSDLDNISFPDLLKQVSAIKGLRRIRFMTSHPKDLSDELIETVSSLSNVCHHVHLPLQSGSDRILKLMNRHYSMEHYISIVEKLRASINDIEITTDLIVGFPDEQEEDFVQTLQAVRSIGFSSAYTFKYSPRHGTAAANMENQIPEQIKKERLKIHPRQIQLGFLLGRVGWRRWRITFQFNISLWLLSPLFCGGRSFFR